MSVKKYSNNHKSVAKDDVIASLIPEYVTECALALQLPAGMPCSSSAGISAIATAVGIRNDDPAVILDAAKTQTGCETERCVLEKLGPTIGTELAQSEIETRLKLVGPNGIE